jgi:hypothetical protein
LSHTQILTPEKRRVEEAVIKSTKLQQQTDIGCPLRQLKDPCNHKCISNSVASFAIVINSGRGSGTASVDGEEQGNG